MIGPMNSIFWFYNCLLWFILCKGITFLGDFADGRLLHDAEVQSSMDLHFILSKVLATKSFSFNSSRKKVISLLREQI